MTDSKLAATIGPLAVLVLMSGCGSSRSRIATAFSNPFRSKSTQIAANAESPPPRYTFITPDSPGPSPADASNPNEPPAFGMELKEEYLLELGERLTLQGQHEQAAGIFQSILQKNPNHDAARKMLMALNDQQQQQTVHAQPQPPETPPVEPTPPTSPSPRIGAPRPSRPVPSAPPVGPEDVPVIKEAATQPPAAQPPVAKSDAEPEAIATAPDPAPVTRYHNTSNRPITVVQRSGAASTPSHTILVIPADKGGVREVQRFHFGETKQASATDARLAKPVLKFNESAIPPADSEPTKSQIRPRLSAPPRPDGTSPKVKNAGPHRVEVVSELGRKFPELIRLAGYARRPAKHVDGISAHLTNRAPIVRSLSAYLLGRASTKAAHLVPKLELLLSSERNGPTRVRLAEALLRISPGHAAAVRVIGDGLHGTERATRWEAVCVIDILVNHDNRDTIVAGLIERLDDADEKICVMAALKLGEFHKERNAILPALLPLAREKKPTKLREASRAAVAVLREKR